MSKTANMNNLDAHYTNNAKVEKPKRVVVYAPDNLPRRAAFNDNKANNRFKNISQDIYNGTIQEKNKTGVNFLKFFVAAVLAIAGAIGIRKIFK